LTKNQSFPINCYNACRRRQSRNFKWNLSQNDDKYLLHVNNLIREHVGLEYAGFIRFQLVPVDSRKVLLIECQPSPSPVFLKIGKDEDFYVRIGPGNRKLSTSEVLAYVTNRKTKL